MRFYVDMPLHTGEQLILPQAVAHHWTRVLRARVGDSAILFNGQGGEYDAHLTHIDKKSATVTIGTHHLIDRTLPYHVTLAQAISKGERMDYTIQKACEMGVSAIQLITSQRSERLRYERDLKKLNHWQGITIAACEQCGLNIIPTILPPMPLPDYLLSCTDILKLMLAPTTDTIYTPTPPLPKRISLLIGAEGGLSDDEMMLAYEHGFHAWQLGERILRTETAGVVAMATLMALDATQL